MHCKAKGDNREKNRECYFSCTKRGFCVLGSPLYIKTVLLDTEADAM